MDAELAREVASDADSENEDLVAEEEGKNGGGVEAHVFFRGNKFEKQNATELEEYPSKPRLFLVNTDSGDFSIDEARLQTNEEEAVSGAESSSDDDEYTRERKQRLREETLQKRAAERDGGSLQGAVVDKDCVTLHQVSRKMPANPPALQELAEERDRLRAETYAALKDALAKAAALEPAARRGDASARAALLALDTEMGHTTLALEAMRRRIEKLRSTYSYSRGVGVVMQWLLPTGSFRTECAFSEPLGAPRSQAFEEINRKQMNESAAGAGELKPRCEVILEEDRVPFAHVWRPVVRRRELIPRARVKVHCPNTATVREPEVTLVKPQ